MNQNKTMIVGVALIFFAIWIFASWTYKTVEEANSIKKSLRFEGGSTLTTKQGALVIIEGNVSMKNKFLIHDFVIAVKERYIETSEHSDWSIIESYRQPVLVDLSPGEIILTSDHVCTQAKRNNFLYAGIKTRYSGLKKGDPVAAIGTLTAHSPATLAVKYWYSGSIEDYTTHMASLRKYSYILFIVPMSMGVGFFIWGWKRK